MKLSLSITFVLALLAVAPVRAQNTQSVSSPAPSAMDADLLSSESASDSAVSLTAINAPESPAPIRKSASDTEPAVRTLPHPKKPDFNREIYYRNKLEFSLETGWLPINVPLIFDFLVNSPYTTWPLHYTMVPTLASLRWQTDGIHGPVILRGNWDFTFSGSYTAIPRGAETRYFAFDYGIRRNFIPHRWYVVPYYEMRGGVGNINAKGPDGVKYAQGQDLTFTYMTGAGARYNISPRYSIEVGAEYMHVSDAYLSLPKVPDYGINVWGPMVGINVRLGKPKASAVH